MIFDKDYDAALWYIVKVDKKNRKEITDFVKEIPDKLLENIRVSIQKFKDGEYNSNDEKLDYYRCNSDNDPRVNYYFQIDDDECLTIKKSFNDDNIFELMLFPIGPERVKYLDNFEEEWVGCVTNNIKTTHLGNQCELINCKEREYNIYKTPIGYFVEYNREILNGKKDIGIYKPINIKEMPKDIKRGNLLCKKYVPNKNK